MGNLFFALTDKSVERPKTVLACVFLVLIILSSGGMYLKFDNSEDGFFPDNDTVALLNQIEDEYQASVDFVRVIDDVEQGDLLLNNTWQQLALTEATMLNNSNFIEYQYPLFGSQASFGMVSSVIQWQTIQDPVNSQEWLLNLTNAIEELRNSSDVDFNNSLQDLVAKANTIPKLTSISADMLMQWEPGNPEQWLSRIDSRDNLTEQIDETIYLTYSLFGFNSNKSDLQKVSMEENLTAMISDLYGLKGQQVIDYRSIILANMPFESREDPWNMSGPIITTLAISSDPIVHGYEEKEFSKIEAKINDWSDLLLLELQQDSGDDELRIFSFSKFGVESTENIGKEIGMLTGSAFMLLAIILWFNFRSKRETAYVMVLTIFAIAATYGLSGWLQYFGVNMVFNAAMNSIPVLLLAIGVDYGLHVVLRVREELKNSVVDSSQATLRDFSLEARKIAIRKGTIFTSIALLIAIFTDMIGFLSFRLSALSFLQVFGTVIAIGLFLIYLLSISALPALMSIIPPKKLPLDKASKIEIGPIAKGLGRLSMQPMKVGVIAVLLLIPMFIGFQQLEVGFEQSEQFDPDIPVVADFLMISEDFQSSRSPLYVVFDGEVLSSEGWASWNMTILKLSQSGDLTGVPTGLWDLI